MPGLNAVGYRFQTNDKPWGGIVPDEKVESEFRRRLKPFDGPMHMREQGHKFGPYKVKPEIITNATNTMLREDVGVQVYVENKAEKGVRCRKVEYDIKLVATSGNEAIDRWATWIIENYNPGVQLWGAMVCRGIGSTGRPSQHSNWGPIANWKNYCFSSYGGSKGGNAIDIHHVQRSVMTEMFYDSIKAADEFCLENLINWPIGSSHPLIWNPERGLHEYDVPRGGSNHFDHVHGDCRPSRTTGRLC